jgi:hypothetical protein
VLAKYEYILTPKIVMLRCERLAFAVSETQVGRLAVKGSIRQRQRKGIHPDMSRRKLHPLELEVAIILVLKRTSPTGDETPPHKCQVHLGRPQASVQSFSAIGEPAATVPSDACQTEVEFLLLVVPPPVIEETEFSNPY